MACSLVAATNGSLNDNDKGIIANNVVTLADAIIGKLKKNMEI